MYFVIRFEAKENFAGDMLGKVLALTCALSWAFAVILFKRAGDSIRPPALNWHKTALTVLVLSPFLIVDGLGGFSQMDLLTVLASGILGIALADTAFNNEAINGTSTMDASSTTSRSQVRG